MKNPRKTSREIFTLAASVIVPLIAFYPQGHAQEKPDQSVPSMQIRKTPERAARGKYLVDGLLWCEFCHSSYDFTKRPATSKPGTQGGGLIFAYLQTLPPIKHRVDNTELPTYCKVCRGKHGLGNLN